MKRGIRISELTDERLGRKRRPQGFMDTENGYGTGESEPDADARKGCIK